MDDNQLLRYSRQILLPQIGIDGQTRLLRSRVLLIGLGGLGSPVAMYLAASGVGQLVLVDHDRVDLTNLQRQIVHTTERIGVEKTISAAQTLTALNPEVQVVTINHQLNEAELTEQVQLADVVVDASDNFATRHQVNRVCVHEKTPLVSGAVVRFEGQVTVFRPDQPDSPCYRCLYGESATAPSLARGPRLDSRTESRAMPQGRGGYGLDPIGEDGAPDEPCSQFGVLAPAVGIIGSIQATEAIKVLLNLGESLAGRLLVLDALTMEWRTLRLKKDPACPVCAAPR